MRLAFRIFSAAKKTVAVLVHFGIPQKTTKSIRNTLTRSHIQRNSRVSHTWFEVSNWCLFSNLVGTTNNCSHFFHVPRSTTTTGRKTQKTVEFKKPLKDSFFQSPSIPSAPTWSQVVLPVVTLQAGIAGQPTIFLSQSSRLWPERELEATGCLEMQKMGSSTTKTQHSPLICCAKFSGGGRKEKWRVSILITFSGGLKGEG